MKKVFKKILLLNKKEGQTPLEALEVFRRKNKKYRDIKMTYAGRLDPMASGLLLVLAGEEIKNKEKYLALDKEYKFQVLFGFATDTYDILGKIVNSIILTNSRIDRKGLMKAIEGNLKFFIGRFVQKYPVYSSKTLKGKALFQYARDGLDVVAPEREVFVKELKFFKLRKVSNRKLLSNIERRIKKIKGDFRQKQILKLWNKKLLSAQAGKNKPQDFFIGSFKLNCSSGTYVRGIANSLGQRTGIPALAFSIKRTKVGKWKA